MHMKQIDTIPMIKIQSMTRNIIMKIEVDLLQRSVLQKQKVVFFDWLPVVVLFTWQSPSEITSGKSFL